MRDSSPMFSLTEQLVILVKTHTTIYDAFLALGTIRERNQGFRFYADRRKTHPLKLIDSMEDVLRQLSEEINDVKAQIEVILAFAQEWEE